MTEPAKPEVTKGAKVGGAVIAVIIAILLIMWATGVFKSDPTYRVDSSTVNSDGDTVVKVSVFAGEATDDNFKDITSDLWVERGSVRVEFTCDSTRAFLAQTSQSSAGNYSGRKNSTAVC